MERFYFDCHRNGYKSRILELRRHIDKYFSRGVTMMSLEYQILVMECHDSSTQVVIQI